MPALAAALVLAACDRQEAPTVGQQVDRAIAESRETAGQIGSQAREAAREATQATRQATAAVAEKARDLGITAQVNAALAKDDRLSALRIDVDTRDGRVTLSGTAPDSDARERATRLCAAVEGVKDVDNRLTIAKSG
jgi:osmotically-inducible protein OsmY